MVIEQPGVFAALGRSRDLVRGYGWPVFGTIVLAALIDLAVNIVAAVVASGLSDAGTAVVNWDRRDADGADLRPHLGGPVLRAPRRQGAHHAGRARRALAVTRRAAEYRLTVSAEVRRSGRIRVAVSRTRLSGPSEGRVM
jgi:hypothetical protein